MEGIIKLVDDKWIDKNGNAWNCEIFTKEEAIENSKSLESCFNCYNCKNCTECIKCSNCNNCENCRFLLKIKTVLKNIIELIF